MTLPNWIIRCIVILCAVPMIMVGALIGAYIFVRDEALPEIGSAWRNPETTRWGRDRT